MNKKSLGKVAFFMSGVAMLCLGVAWAIIQVWIPYFWMIVAFAGAFFAVGMFFERRMMVDFFTMKTTKNGMNMGVTILLVFVVLVMINFVAIRKTKTWDFSLAQSNSISDQSIKLVQSLEDDVQILFFYKQGDESSDSVKQAFRILVRKYQDRSDRVKLEFVEINSRPDLTEKYAVTSGKSEAYVDYKGRRSRLDRLDEQSMTSAILQVTREKQKTVYFLTGHGEHELERSDAMGLNKAKAFLESNRYIVKAFSLLTSESLPADADVIVISGPTQAYQAREVSLLTEYLNKGGNLLVALDWKNSAGLDALLEKAGITMGSVLIRNFQFDGKEASVADGPTYATEVSSTSKITQVFGKNTAFAFLLPTNMLKGKVPEGVTLDEIVKTPPNSVEMTDLKTPTDKVGSATIGMTAMGKLTKDSPKEFYLAAFGDSEFMTNQQIATLFNRDLVQNLMAGLARDENMISIAPRDVQSTPITVTTKAQLGMIALILGFPFLMLGIGITMIVRRRMN